MCKVEGSGGIDMSKKLVSSFWIILIFAFYMSSTLINAASDECVFYDDFENGAVFWDYGNHQSMRISDGKMVTDNKTSLAEVTLRGSKAWENFVMDTVFETDYNETGWFGIHIGFGTDSRIQFVIHKSGFYTVQTPVSESGEKAFELENNKQYLLRITAQMNEVTVQVKDVSESDFSVEWKGIYENPVSGGIRVASYDQIAKIDSVKITQAVDEMIFFKDSMVAVQQDESKTIVPEMSGEFDSIRYTCIGESFTVSDDGTVTANSNGNGYGVVTATATHGDETYTTSYDVVRTIPVESLGNGGYFRMNTGDTMNLSINISPLNATDRAVLWSVDNEEALELVGDKTGEAIGVRALSPAKNVRVSARLKDDASIIYSAYITVEGRPSNIKAQRFTFNGKKREIPSGMLGLSMNSLINSATTKQTVDDYEALHLPFLDEMNIQQLRLTLEKYDGETDTFLGKDFVYTISDFFENANKLDIPVNITLSEYYDCADKIIALVKAIRNVTDKEICLGIWEECYDGRMLNYSAWPVKCAADYTAFLKEIYPKVKEAFPDGSVKIGATAVDYDLYNAAGGGTGDARKGLLSAWNHALLDAKDYYDAVCIHQYSGGVLDLSTQGVMDGFAIASTSFMSGVDKQAEEFFAGKEFWINEWGDLPKYLTSSGIDSTMARNQYMKSLGNAMGYLHRQFEMTLNENITMSAYYSYDDSMGFGVVSTLGEIVHKMPSYYMFSMIGDIFANNKYIYDMTDSIDPDLSYFVDTGYYDNNRVTKVNAWTFGNETRINEAVFENASEYYVKAYIPGYSIQKRMLYGNGENPLPDLGVNTNFSFRDIPVSVTLPEYFEDEEYVNYVILPPYSVLRASLKECVEWEVVFEDDFSSGNLSKWEIASGYVYDSESAAMKTGENNVYAIPAGVDASTNISIQFDMTGNPNGGVYLVFKANDDSTFKIGLHGNYIEFNDYLGSNNDLWYKFGYWDVTSGTHTVKATLENGVLTVCKKNANGDFDVIGSVASTDEEIRGEIENHKAYYPIFWNLHNHDTTVIDNVLIEADKKYLGTEEIRPVYDTVFEDDFSDTALSKWTKSWIETITGIGANVTSDKTLQLDSNNKYLTPSAEIASDTIEFQYDFCGNDRHLMIEFYNIEDENDSFFVRSSSAEAQVKSEILNKDFSVCHYFGGLIEKNKWQTIKFVLRDGLLQMYVKDTDEAEFVERKHLKGAPYSYIWYDKNGENVSLMKRDTRYGVRLYTFNADDSTTYIDNLKINAVNTEVSETASNGDNISFEVKDLRIEVKTDDCWEVTSKPVSGAINRFTVKSEALQGSTIGGNMIIAAYGENKRLLMGVLEEDISENISVEMMYPYESNNIKIMFWEGFESIKPLLKAIEY